MRYYKSEMMLLIGCTLLGLAVPFMKEAVGISGVYFSLAVRFLAGAGLLFLVSFFAGGKAFLNIKFGGLLGLIMSFEIIIQTVGLSLTTAANSGFITSLTIVILPLCAFFMEGEKPEKQKIVAMAVALIGLWVLTGGVDGFNTGDALTLLAVLFIGIRLILSRRYVARNKLDALPLCFQQLAVVGVVSLIIAVFMPAVLTFGGSGNTIKLLSLGILGTGTAFLLILISQKQVDPVQMAIILTFQPLVTALYSWTLGGEKFVPMSAVGGGLMVAGMLISEIRWKSSI